MQCVTDVSMIIHESHYDKKYIRSKGKTLQVKAINSEPTIKFEKFECFPWDLKLKKNGIFKKTIQ